MLNVGQPVELVCLYLTLGMAHGGLRWTPACQSMCRLFMWSMTVRVS
jgi:hypothetical protein